MKPIKRAILSTYNKTGLVQLGLFLAHEGVKIFSTGGSARVLRAGGVPLEEISSLTGFPEILDGRVKTLHPHVHGGILARDTEEHMGCLEEHGIAPVDLVVVNLYPFEETIAQEGITDEQAIEMIDIGGPTMIRAAAKNHHRVTVLSDPSDYPLFMDRYKDGALTLAHRRAYALKVFRQTSQYDAAISAWLLNQESPEEQI